MARQITLSGSSNKPYVPTSTYEDEPIYELLTLSPGGTGAEQERAQLNLVLVVDASGTMYNFQLSPEEREYWLSLALSRNEMERGLADERDAVYWSGQTLQEMHAIVRKPMTLAVDAIKQLLSRLESGDGVTVLAFADQTYTVFTDRDWATRPAFCYNALDDLLEQRYPYEIGTGTHLSAALAQAVHQLDASRSPGSTDRMIVISDGIVQDRRETFHVIEDIREKEYAASTIGVGDEFDEEFLMRVADVCHGAYHYAAQSADITDSLMAELTTMQATALHQVSISAEGLSGAIVQDVYMVSPSMTIFDEMEAGGGVLRARIGDLSGDRPTLLLLQVAPSLLPAGEHDLASVTVSWRDATDAGAGEQSSTVRLIQRFTDDPMLLAQRNNDIQDYVDRFKIYRYEREAQRAQERGDLDGAREKLGAATRELQRLGETGLAADLQEQINAIGSGLSDPSRVKRIKATTRKLGEKVVPTTGA